MFIAMLLLLLIVIVCASAVLGLTHAYTMNWANGGTNPINTAITVTGTAEIVSQTVATDNTTTHEVLAFAHANLQSIYILSPNDLTLNTNAADGTGGDSITIAGGQPFIWYLASGVTCPFSHDVTAFYWVNASMSLSPTVQVRILYNA